MLTSAGKRPRFLAYVTTVQGEYVPFNASGVHVDDVKGLANVAWGLSHSKPFFYAYAIE